MIKFANIPRDVEDAFYRYKMPLVKTKVESQGNGVKTVIVNCSDVAKSLNRNPDHLSKFFGFEFGAVTMVQNGKYIIRGSQDVEPLQKALDVFIEKFVLCGVCRLPETVINIKGTRMFLNCRACGQINECDPNNKLVAYIIKHEGKGFTEKDKIEKPKTTKQRAEGEGEDQDWCLSTSKEDVEERRRDTLGYNDRLSAGDDKAGGGATEATLTIAPGHNPVEILSNFWDTNPSHAEALSKVKALATAQAWSEVTLLRNYIFPSLFAKDIRIDFYKKAGFLRLFVKDNKAHQKLVLYCIEKLCIISPDTIGLLPGFLQGLFTTNVLDEETIIQWYKHPINDPKRLDPKVSKAVRDSAKVMIEWLQAEDVSEEDF